METRKTKAELHAKSPQPAEEDYNAHSSNPGPSAEAIEEKDEDGAGKALKWVIPVVVILLTIVWFLFFRDTAPS